MSKFSKKKEL